jgi:hypothetical protein
MSDHKPAPRTISEEESPSSQTAFIEEEEPPQVSAVCCI